MISEGRVERKMNKQVAREPLLRLVGYLIIIRQANTCGFYHSN